MAFVAVAVSANSASAAITAESIDVSFMAMLKMLPLVFNSSNVPGHAALQLVTVVEPHS